MGKRAPGEPDQANLVKEKNLTTGAGAASSYTDWIEFLGTANVAISGAGTGTVIVEKSFDGGDTAIPLTNLGVAVAFTGPATEVIFNREAGVLHRLRRTVATAGNMFARISQ